MDLAGLPLSIQEAQTAHEEAARGSSTPRSAEMFNVQAVQLRRHALTAAASLARDCTLLHPEAFLCVVRTRTGRYTASCLQRLNPSALPHATPYDTRALTL